MVERLKELIAEGKLLEAQRLEQRTNFDLEMIAATGSCAGIENYSRFLTGRLPGEPPPTLFEYLPENAVLFVDESHQTVPQIADPAFQSVTPSEGADSAANPSKAAVPVPVPEAGVSACRPARHPGRPARHPLRL